MPDSYTTYGNFLLLKQRSKDGLGTLWRAGELERTGFKRIVWLRRFDLPGLDRAALTADAAVAGQLAQVLKASNVVRNASYASEAGTPYMAWDYVPAQPLDQLLARAASEQFPIAIDNALLIAEKLAAALSAALAVEVQGEPLTHGFLVPHLVVVGNDGEAMVAGFGLGRGLRGNLSRAAVKELAAPYLAPEVLANGPAGRRGDVYSLGALLYHLLTGTPLPADPAARAAALAAPQLAFEEGPVPQDVLGILRKALETKPDDRHASAVEFKKDLEKLLYGGAYSPTTFNLALFMDRLYRGEIEEEDRELQREKAMDVTRFVQAAAKPAATPAAAPPPPPQKRTMLYAMIGGAVVLLGVIAYLLVSRPGGSGAMDKAAQEKMFKELVSQQVDEQMKKLATELEAERAHTAQLRSELDKQKQAVASGAKKLSPEEQQRQEELQKKLAAQEAEQKRKEEEFAKARQAAEAQRQRQAAQGEVKVAAAQPTAAAAVPASTVAPAVATTTPAMPTAAPASTATAAPATPTPVVASPTSAPVDQAPVAAGLGTGVREGDLVDWGQLDVRPEVLIEAPVNVPRSANMTRMRMTGLVILKALVNERGRVDDAQVLRGFQPPKPGVDEACVESVKKYTFKPGMKNGLRVKTWMTITQQVALPPAR
ncbi:MAG TPA: TonB family protein [Thermoanaerobaculaceae bacterium]|nr:TonB family protein [Thermoanaerobaculaceae bacterium]